MKITKKKVSMIQYTRTIVKSKLIENQLLKQLNNELLDKNRILNELLTRKKQSKSNNIKTYAEITSNPKPKNKRGPKLIIE